MFNPLNRSVPIIYGPGGRSDCLRCQIKRNWNSIGLFKEKIIVGFYVDLIDKCIEFYCQFLYWKSPF